MGRFRIGRVQYHPRLDAEFGDLCPRLIRLSYTSTTTTAVSQPANLRPFTRRLTRRSKPIASTTLAVKVMANSLERRGQNKPTATEIAFQKQGSCNLSQELWFFGQILES
jgi:hypothetical protein